MNIYDEALKEMKDVHIDVADCFDGFKMNYDLDKIIKALERAKKVEELLELYRKYSKGLVSGKLSIQELYELNLKIKEKEKELKETKL